MTHPRRSTRTDGEKTYNRILEAAGKLFAKTGSANTANKDIALEAGVDLASINYHFGSRGDLYQAVLAEAHKRILDINDLQKVADTKLLATEKLRRFIELLVRGAMNRDGWHGRVFGREMMASSSKQHAALSREVQPKFMVIMNVLSEITGLAVDDPALLRCMISIGAPCLLLLVADQDVPSPPQQLLRMPHADLVEHFFRFSLAGLKAISKK